MAVRKSSTPNSTTPQNHSRVIRLVFIKFGLKSLNIAGIACGKPDNHKGNQNQNSFLLHCAFSERHSDSNNHCLKCALLLFFFCEWVRSSLIWMPSAIGKGGMKNNIWFIFLTFASIISSQKTKNIIWQQAYGKSRIVCIHIIEIGWGEIRSQQTKK